MALTVLNSDRGASDDGCDELIPVSHIPGELKQITEDGCVPKHRELVQQSNDAIIAPPMERLKGRFWFCRRENLPLLATKLGLRLTAYAEHRFAA